MGYFIGIIVLLCTFIFGAVASSGIKGLPVMFNPSAFLVILIPALAVAFSSVSLKRVPVGKILFSQQPESSTVEAKKVFEFFHTLGNASILLGIVVYLISTVLLLTNLENPRSIGPNMSLGIISLLYATIWKVIAFSAECRVRKKAGLSNDAVNANLGDWVVYLYPILPLMQFFILIIIISK